jgi:D-alanine transaminase
MGMLLGFEPMTVFLNGQYLPRQQAVVSLDDRGFLLGDGVYEVIRVYHGRPFQMDAHLKRLQNGLDAIRIQGVDISTFHPIAERLLVDNGLTQSGGTIYIQITRGAAPRQHAFPAGNILPTVFVAAEPLTPQQIAPQKAITAILIPDLRWCRCDIKTISLVANVLARQSAIDAGVMDAILVRDGVALEGTSSNLFAVSGGVVITHPKTNRILPGVTRDVALELCLQNKIPYQEAPILEQEIHQAQELFITSTTQEIAPIVELDHRVIGDGKPGSITRKLQQSFADLVEEFLASQNAQVGALN